MPRAAKQCSNAMAQVAHEARLRKRRELRREQRANELTAKAAGSPAEGQADFESLVEAEKARMETREQTAGRKGGSQTPKNMVQARENLTHAFDLMGGVPALVVWGRINPTEFYRIWARLIPKEAVESNAALPLETLLSKLAEKDSLSVAEAAMQIGQETMEAARVKVLAEDLSGAPDGETLN